MMGKLKMLFSSPLLWLGLAGVAACVTILLTGGNLGPIGFAYRFGIVSWFPLMFPGIFWASVALAVSGMVLGIVRVCRSPKSRHCGERSSANQI